MNMSEFRDWVLDKHEPHSHRHGIASVALDAIREGLTELSKLGHHVELQPGAPPAPLRFPLMLTHSTEPPGELVVNNSAEEAEAKAKGWKEVGAPEAPTAAPAPAPPA